MSNITAVRTELMLGDETHRALMEHSPLKVLLQASFNVGLYVALCFLGTQLNSWWAWLSIWVIQGFILSGFLGAAHDCAHGSFSRRPIVNHLAGAFWASTVLFNYTLYKYFHLEHHRYTTVPGDTEPLGVFKGFWDYVRSLPTTAFFVSFWIMSVQTTFGRFPHFVKTRKARRDVRIDNFALFTWILLAAALTVIWPRQSLLFYWGPMAIYFPMVFLTSLPEHYGCDEGPDPLSNTRSMSPNFLFRYIFWNGNYHAEHHVYPNLPSHNLPRLHALIGNKFKFRESSYVRFHVSLVRELLRNQAATDQKFLSALKRVEYDVYEAPETAASNVKKTL